MMSPEQLLFKLFREQHGATATTQALALGVPRHRLNHLVRIGQLRRVSYGILAPSGMPPTWEHQAMVGVLRGGYGARDGSIPAALFGLTAAAIRGLENDPPDEIDILTTRRVDPTPGYRFHRTSRLPEDEIVRVEGIPSTDPVRTLIDVCDVAPFRARTVFYRGLRTGAFTADQVLTRCDLESRRGRGGLQLARSIAERSEPGAERAKSAREGEVFRWLVDAGLPPPERNYKVASSFGWDWEIDLFYPNELHGIEVSPYWHHGDHLTYERDNLKTNDLRSMGINIVKVTDGTTRAELLRTIRSLFRS